MIRAAALCLLASPAFGQDIDVQFQDGNPLDRFIAFNRGCPIAAATLTVDFTTSRGGIVIDAAADLQSHPAQVPAPSRNAKLLLNINIPAGGAAPSCSPNTTAMRRVDLDPPPPAKMRPASPHGPYDPAPHSQNVALSRLEKTHPPRQQIP